MSDYPRTQRRLVRVTDTTTGEYGDLVLTLCYVVEAGATGRVALACEAHEYENDGAIASHLIFLDDQFQATCVDSGYHFAVLIGPQPWRIGLGRKAPPVEPVTRSCPACQTSFTTRRRQTYCSAACRPYPWRKRGSVVQTPCKRCSDSFTYESTTRPPLYCTTCRVAVQREARHRRKQLAKQRDPERWRANKRAENQRRAARQGMGPRNR